MRTAERIGRRIFLRSDPAKRGAQSQRSDGPHARARPRPAKQAYDKRVYL
jgi:hypothetical protein